MCGKNVMRERLLCNGNFERFWMGGGRSRYWIRGYGVGPIRMCDFDSLS